MDPPGNALVAEASPPHLCRIGVWRTPLPQMRRAFDRLLVRLVASVAMRQIRAIHGLERILPGADPFILAANHSSRREALYLPAILLLARGGRPVHFLADWNFRLIPGVGYLYDRSGTITVTRKPARPAILDHLRPLVRGSARPYGQALERLHTGHSVALFPEGTVNRSGQTLMRARRGAARLALASGSPLIPLGVRFERRSPGGESLRMRGPIELRFGEPLPATADLREAGRAGSDRLSSALMERIAALSGKSALAAPDRSARRGQGVTPC